MMMKAIVTLSMVLSAVAFAPSGRIASKSLSMVLDGVGEAPEVGGLWDPLNLLEGKEPETIEWYRAAELKHGRVCMLAAVGLLLPNSGFPGTRLQDIFLYPNPTFEETNPFKAVQRVYYENPAALVQIMLAISAIEVFTASISKFSSRPGDFNWDPLGIRPADEAKLNELQTKELKNGRLAMLSTAGMAYQTYVTGQGPWEQLTSGHISPFGDGQGFF